MPMEEMQPIAGEDLTQGFCIKIEVYPDGFTVSDPLPLDTKEYAEGEEEQPEQELIPDLTSMLKNVMVVVNENPVNGGEEKAFDDAAAIQ